VAAAAAAARLSVERPDRAAECADFGAVPEDPALSLVAAIGENLDVVRARAAMLFAEPGAAEVEVVCHAPAGPLAEAARGAIAAAVAATGIGHRLVTVARGADAADRLVAALGQARGAAVLILGADVLPAGPGWLAPWRCRLVPARPVLGGTLIDPAGSVIDAGGMPDDQRRFTGLPAADLPGAPALATRLATAECVGLTRAAAERFAAATRYPNPDVMLAETIAGIAAEGGEAATLVRSRFVRYAGPAADGRAECVDCEAIRLVLKRSFSPSGDQGRA
jgi:hypothetical protein